LRGGLHLACSRSLNRHFSNHPFFVQRGNVRRAVTLSPQHEAAGLDRRVPERLEILHDQDFGNAGSLDAGQE